MKTQSTSLLLASGIAIGMLTSCVVPFDPNGGTSVTTTTYQPGYRISSLPSGYRSELISGTNYYYHNGAYYRPESNGYVVVDAPRTSRYYTEYDRQRASRHDRSSTNYQETQNDNVTVVTRLPSGYRAVNYGGSQYYQSGENYYRRQGDGYVVVSRPY